MNRICAAFPQVNPKQLELRERIQAMKGISQAFKDFKSFLVALIPDDFEED